MRMNDHLLTFHVFTFDSCPFSPNQRKDPPMNIPITGLPGIGVVHSATPREILAGNAQLAQFVPGLRTIDGSRSRDPLNTIDIDVLRAGILLGKITSGGKYAPSVLGVLTVAAAGPATSLTVPPARPTPTAPPTTPTPPLNL